jgi:hypothetical protein
MLSLAQHLAQQIALQSQAAGTPQLPQHKFMDQTHLQVELAKLMLLV